MFANLFKKEKQSGETETLLRAGCPEILCWGGIENYRQGVPFKRWSKSRWRIQGIFIEMAKMGPNQCGVGGHGSVNLNEPAYICALSAMGMGSTPGRTTLK